VIKLYCFGVVLLE